MLAFYADHFVLPLPEGHRFPMQKYALLRQQLQHHLTGIVFRQALAASDDELALVHTQGYIDAVTQGHLSTATQREIGFPWSLQMAERARRSVGATLQAARAALGGDCIAASLAGGTHHAYADKGAGFCVFNDVAVAARCLQRQCAAPCIGQVARQLRVAIVDLDVHQGDGTAHIFREDPSVFTLSLHGARNFPLRKQKSDCDIELPDGCQDGQYLEALDDGLSQLDDRFKPDLIFYLAGADPHEGDRLGRLALTDSGMQFRDRRVFEWAAQHRTPVAMVMGGGYGREMETTIRVQVNTYRVAMEYWQRSVTPKID
jgi:acetoin utilization deacetylase AcuC-like enzyme